MASPEEILERLREVPYPGFKRDIVSFGVVKDIHVGGEGTRVHLTPPSPDREKLETIRVAIERIVVEMGAGPVAFDVEEPKRPDPVGKAAIEGVHHIVAVASGKGGVGKSTVAVNLAMALARTGHRVGLLDADVYGPSVPTMLGLTEKPVADEQKRIHPLERNGVRVMSMGLFLERTKAVVWRGPMLTKALNEFARNVLWGELDVLVLDLPPGTGDAQLTICQNLPLSGGVIVTTPQAVALMDVERGVQMFHDVGVPVLGVIENMNVHVCGKCGRETAIFGSGGGVRMAAELGVPLLATLPYAREIREGGDEGSPIVLGDPGHPQSLTFLDVARQVAEALDKAPEAREAL